MSGHTDDRANLIREALEVADNGRMRGIYRAAAEALDSLAASLLQAERERNSLSGKNAMAAGALDAERRVAAELREALATLRAAWNAHFATCTMPPPHGVTLEQIEKWKDAPSNTASAELGRAAVPAPTGDDERYPNHVAGCICPRFKDITPNLIADLTCPIHGVNGTNPGDILAASSGTEET